MAIITEEFKNAVRQKNKQMVHIMMKDSMVVDPTFVEFEKMKRIAEADIPDLYDANDGEVFQEDTLLYTEDELYTQLMHVTENFSRERIDYLKRICAHVYKERAAHIRQQQLEHLQATSDNPKKSISYRKRLGTGLLIGGLALTAAGFVLPKIACVAIGVAAATSGGILIATTSKEGDSTNGN